jgi:hypothetical protein
MAELVRTEVTYSEHIDHSTGYDFVTQQPDGVVVWVHLDRGELRLLFDHQRDPAVTGRFRLCKWRLSQGSASTPPQLTIRLNLSSNQYNSWSPQGLGPAVLGTVLETLEILRARRTH